MTSTRTAEGGDAPTSPWRGVTRRIRGARPTVSRGELARDSVCVCQAAVKAMPKSQAGIHNLLQPGSLQSWTCTREHRRKLADRQRRLRPGLVLATGKTQPGLRPSWLLRPLITSFLTLSGAGRGSSCWMGLLFPGNSTDWKDAFTPLQSQRPRQAGTHLPSLPQDSHCSPERLPGLAYCPFQLSPGRAC